MKNYLLIAGIALSMTACNRAELDKSYHKSDSLLAVVQEREASLNEFIASFNEIEGNLDSVAIKQNIISQNTEKEGELKPNQKERINSEIQAINQLMEENRKKIAELTKKMKNSSMKNLQLEKTIATLNDQITRKDAELSALNEKLLALNTEVEKLNISVVNLTEENQVKTEENTRQAKVIEENTIALHTAYYVVGKTKDLQAAGLIDRQGGLLGMGKTAKLSQNFDTKKFTRVDYTQTPSIAISNATGEVKVVTSHPADSYKLERDNKIVKSLTITNAEKFWSASKYLVIAL
jgi:uncharacterized coiled-coil protein SlyX